MYANHVYDSTMTWGDVYRLYKYYMKFSEWDGQQGTRTLRVYPKPDCVEKSDQGSNEEIYVKIQGFSEFTIGGLLKDYNITGRLHEI